jgi:pimeloyl-ACP methyl ester carboxylesterase
VTLACRAPERALTLDYQGRCYHARHIRQPDPRSEPIVLIGGAFQHQRAWGRIELGLLRTADVITVDLPGSGSADPVPAGLGLDFLTGALDQLLVSLLGSAPVNVVGASYGSAIAHRWVSQHPERTARLTLIGTMAQLTDHVRERMQHTLQQLLLGHRAAFADSVLAAMMCLRPEVKITRRAAVARCLTSALENLTSGEVEQYVANTRRLLDHRAPEVRRGQDGQEAEAPVSVPVLVATGEHDPLTTPALNREAASRCTDARFTTVKDADHLLHLERPAEVVDLVTRFLTGRPLDGLDYCNAIEYSGANVADQVLPKSLTRVPI